MVNIDIIATWSKKSDSTTPKSDKTSGEDKSGIVGGDAGLRTRLTEGRAMRGTTTKKTKTSESGIVGGDAGLRTKITDSRRTKTADSGIVGGDAGLRVKVGKSKKKTDSGLIGGDAGLRTQKVEEPWDWEKETAKEIDIGQQIEKQKKTVEERKQAFETALQKAVTEGKAKKTEKGYVFTDISAYKKVKTLYRSYVGASVGLSYLQKKAERKWFEETEKELIKAKIPREQRKKIFEALTSGKEVYITTPTTGFIEPIYWRKVPESGIEFDAALRRVAKVKSKEEPTHLEKLYFKIHEKEMSLRAAEVDVSAKESPFFRFAKGLELSAKSFGVGLAYSGVAIPMAAEKVLKSPVEGTKEVVTGTVEWFRTLAPRIGKGLSGSPVEAGLVSGEIAGGFIFGEGVGRGLGKGMKSLTAYKLKSVIEFKPPIELFYTSDYAPSKIKTKPAIIGRTLETIKGSSAFIQKGQVFEQKVSPFKYTMVYKSILKGKKIVSVVGEGERITLTVRKEPLIGKAKTYKTTWEFVEEVKEPTKKGTFEIQRFHLFKGKTKPFEYATKETFKKEEFKPVEVTQGKGKQVLLTVEKAEGKGKIRIPRGFTETMRKTTGKAKFEEVVIPIVYPPAAEKMGEEGKVELRPKINIRGFQGIFIVPKTFEFYKGKPKFDINFRTDTQPIIKTRTKTREEYRQKTRQETFTFEKEQKRVKVTTGFGINMDLNIPIGIKPKNQIRTKKKGDFEFEFKTPKITEKRRGRGKKGTEFIAFMPTLYEIEVFEARTGKEAGALIAPKAAPYWREFKEKLFLTEIPVAQEILGANKKKRKTNKGKKRKRKKSRGVKK